MRGKRPKSRKRSIFNLQKRFVAFLLAAVMTVTNISANWNVAYAGSAEEVEFEVAGSDLLLSLKDAISNGDVVTGDAFDFTNGAVDKFHELFLGNGVVYELFPEVMGSGMEAELRIFARLSVEADDAYIITGEEEIILMYINNSETTLNCQTRIDDKSLKQVTVKSFDNVFGDDEIEIISKPSEEIVIDTPATDNAVPDTDDTQEPPVTDEVQDNEEHDSVVEIEDTTKAETDAAEPSEEESQTPIEEASEDVKDSTEEAAEPEPSDEPEAVEEPETAAEPVASISAYYVPRVAEPSEDAVESTDAVQEPEEKSEPEALPPEPAQDNTADQEQQPPSDDETQDLPTEETLPSVETLPSTETETSAEPEAPTETEPSTEPTVPFETEPQSQEETQPQEEAQPAPVIPDVATGSEVTLPEETVKAETANENDLVGIGNCSTAKIYSVSLNDLLKKSYPKFRYTETTENGVKVTLRAKAGVLPSGTVAEIIDVTDNVKDAITETSDGSISDIVACDITLKDSDGNVLDNDSWIGKVQVTFSGSPVKEVTQGSETIAVMCIDTEVDTRTDVLSAEDVNKLEVVNEMTPDHAEGINQVNFDAEHFTTYFAAGVSEYAWFYNSLYIEQILTDPVTNNKYVQKDEVRLKKDNFVDSVFDYSQYTSEAVRNKGVMLTGGDFTIHKDSFDRYGDATVQINYTLQDGYYVYLGSEGKNDTVRMKWISEERVQSVTDEKYPIYINGDQYRAIHPTNSHYISFRNQCTNTTGFEPSDPSKHYVILRDTTGFEIGYIRCDKYNGETDKDTYYRVIFENEQGDKLREASIKEGTRPIAPNDIENLEGWYQKEDSGKEILKPLPEITSSYANKYSVAYPGGADAIVFVAKIYQKPVHGRYEIDVDKAIVKVVTKAGVTYEGEDFENDVKRIEKGVTAGDTITYKVKVENKGTLPLTNITVKDTIMNSGNPIMLDEQYSIIKQLEPGQFVDFTYDYTVQPEDVKRYDGEFELENEVAVTAAEKDNKGNPVTDSSSEDIDLKDIEFEPELKIKKTASNTTPKLGEEFFYTLTVSNTGKGSARNVKVTDRVPEGFVLTHTSPRHNSRDGRTYQWNFDKLAPNEKKEIKLFGYVKKDLKIGTEIFNTAYINNDQSSTETIVVTDSLLDIKKTADVTSVKPGGTFNYTLKVTNSGNRAAKNIIVTDKLPSDLEFVKSNIEVASKGYYGYQWKLDVLDPNSHKDIVITVKVKDSVEPDTIISNTAYLDGCKSDTVKIPVTGNRVKITKEADKSLVAPGEEFTYKLKVKNISTKSVAKGVVVTDTLPSELEFVGSSPAVADSDSTQSKYQWVIGEIKPGKTAVIEVKVKVKDALEAGTKIKNTAFADNKSSNEKIVTVKGVKLEIEKTASEHAVKHGEVFSYTLEVHNSGNMTATNVKVTDSLPQELEYKNSLPNISAINEGVYEWTIQSIRPGGSASILVLVKVKDSIEPAAEIVNVAKIGDIVSNEEKVTVMDSNLVIVKAVEPANPKPGDKVKYTLTVTNTGNRMSGSSIVEDKLSDALEFVSKESTTGAINMGSNTYRWRLLPIGSGKTRTITLTAKVKDDTAPGTKIENLATVNGRESETVEIIVTGALLEIEKTADTKTPVPGGPVTYTLKVTNNGNADAQNVIVKDTLPQGLKFVSEGSTAGYTNPDDRTYQWTLDTLAAGETRNITIVAKVTAEKGMLISNIGYVNDIPSEPEEIVVGDLSYIVNYYKDAVDDSQIVGEGNLLGSERITDQEYLAVITAQDVDRTKYVPIGYKSDGRMEPETLTILTEEGKNIINVIYDMDPEQTQDVSYMVEHYLGSETTPRDTTTVTAKIWIGSPRIIKVTAESLQPKSYSGYTFSSYAPSNIVAGMEVDNGVVIKMMYTASSPSVTPGGGGTGGGSSSGSGGGSSRYNAAPGGPGVTAIIEPEEVPLAPAPETTLIDDGEIPLIGLPKTGQEEPREVLTLVLAGIFLAMTAISRKRRENV